MQDLYDSPHRNILVPDKYLCFVNIPVAHNDILALVGTVLSTPAQLGDRIVKEIKG